MYNKCVYAGSFDPITNGHAEIIGKCAMMFEKVIVLVAVNFDKKYTFDMSERLEMVRAACARYDGVEVFPYEGMLADYLKNEGIKYYVRGIRDQKDVEYENKSFEFNSKRYPEIENVYLHSGKENSKVSSTLVRKLLSEGKKVDKYVPFEVLPLLEKYAKKIR